MEKRWYERSIVSKGNVVNDTVDNMVKVQATIRPQEGVRLGQGYNIFQNNLRGFALNSSFSPSISSGPDTIFELQKVDNREQLRKHMGVSASASYSGIFSVDAKSKWTSDKITDKRSIHLLASVKVTNEFISLSEYKLLDDAKNFLTEHQNDWSAFYKRYGNEFISQLLTGGEFYALYKFEYNSEEDKKKIEASLSGSYGGFKAAADFETALDEIKTSVNISVNYCQKGGERTLPDYENQVNLINYILSFPKSVAPETNDWVIYSARTKDYDVVTDFPTDNPFTGRKAIDNKKIFEEISPIYDDILDLDTLYKEMGAGASAIFGNLPQKVDEVKGQLDKIVLDIAMNPFENHTVDLDKYKNEVKQIWEQHNQNIRYAVYDEKPEPPMRQTAVDRSGRKWGIKTDGTIYTKTNSETEWKQVPGSLKDISVDLDGRVWGVNHKNEICTRNGVNDDWHGQGNARLQGISVDGNGRVWGISPDNKSVFTKEMKDASWENIQGVDLKHISAATDGRVWGVGTNDNRIYTRDGYFGKWKEVYVDWF